MKIAMLLSNPFKPDPRVYKEARTLVKNGYRVAVLAWDRECRFPKREVVDGIEVRRVRQRAPYGSFSNLILMGLLFWFRCLIFLLKGQFDVIHSHDFDTAIPGLIAAKIKNLPFVYDVHDYYPNMVAKRVPPFIVTLLERFEGVVLKRVDHVITVNEKLKSFLLRKGAKKVTCIMNCVDLAEYPPKTGEVHPNTRLKILYVGALVKDRGIDHMIKVVLGLDNVDLTLAGYGAEKELFVQKIPRDCKKVKFIGEVHPSEVPNLLRSHDVTFALRDIRFASPNKLFQAMAVGLPIIVSEKTVMGEIVRSEKCGLVVKYGDLNELKNAVMSLQKNVKLRKELGQNGLRAAKRKYNWRIMGERLVQLYEGLTK